MKQKIMAFILVLTCIFSCCNVVYGISPPPSMGGTIFLPDGKVAPPGGIKLKVIVESSESALTRECTISEGENSTPYSFQVYFSVAGGLEIRCELVTPVEGYYDVSYYTGSSQKPFKCDAVKTVEMRTEQNLNITLVESKKVTGEIVLPDVMPVQRDSSVTVNFVAQSDPYAVEDSGLMTDIYFSKEVNAVIKEGKKSGTFEVDLPVYLGGYYYNYNINDYISGVSPASNKFDSSNKLLGDSSVSMVLEKGNIIRGVVKLPEGEVSGKGGLLVRVSAFYFTPYISITGPAEYTKHITNKVIIPEGENSIGYEVTVCPEYSKYYMKYSLDERKHVNIGYYSQAGTVSKLDLDNCAVKVTEDVKGIDLCVLNGVKLSGKIMCPEGEVATEDLTGILMLYNNCFLDYKYVIEKGSSFTNFEFILPADLEDFILRYEIDSCKYASMGFYTDNGTMLDAEKAQLLSAKNSSIENIQFYVLPNKKINGKIYLPKDMDSIAKPQSYEIAALTRNADGTCNKVAKSVCHIAPSERSTLFELFVPDEFDEVIISCSFVMDSVTDVPLAIDGYLGEDGMVLDAKNAKVICPGKTGNTDLEIVPIKGERISGVITVDGEHQDVKDRSIFLQYCFVDVTGEDTVDYVELKWKDKESDSQEFFINIPPRYMGEKFRISLSLGLLITDTVYLGENGLTKYWNEAKLFTYDGEEIKDLKISFGASPDVLYGDINSDGKVNSIDLAKLRGYLLGTIVPAELNLTSSDLNLDGAVNSLDFALLRQYLLKIIGKLPVVKTI